MGKHGSRVQIRWKGGVSWEDGTPKVFRGVSEGIRKFISYLRDKEMFLEAEETMIGSFEVGIRGVSMGKCMLKLAMEGLAFLVIPSIHRTGFVLFGRWIEWSEGGT
jgi:hypothetical protein